MLSSSELEPLKNQKTISDFSEDDNKSIGNTNAFTRKNAIPIKEENKLLYVKKTMSNNLSKVGIIEKKWNILESDDSFFNGSPEK
jgi:hypothetical protein